MNAPEKIKILIVDDEKQIRRALNSILSARKYKVIEAANGNEAIDLAIDTSPDLIVLDLALPGLNGLEVCASLREWYAGPILVLSVRSAEEDKIKALDTGADDYLTKPFSAGELVARVKALLRRSAQAVAQSPIMTVGELEIDLSKRRVKEQGREIDLTRIEFDILAYLAGNRGCVVTYKMLMGKVWGPEYGGDNQSLRVHISHLRKKIERRPAVLQYIITEPGVGFRFFPGQLP